MARSQAGSCILHTGGANFYAGRIRMIVRLYLEVGQIKRNFVTFAPPSSRKGKQKQERTGKWSNINSKNQYSIRSCNWNTRVKIPLWSRIKFVFEIQCRKNMTQDQSGNPSKNVSLKLNKFNKTRNPLCSHYINNRMKEIQLKKF